MSVKRIFKADTIASFSLLYYLNGSLCAVYKHLYHIKCIFGAVRHVLVKRTLNFRLLIFHFQMNDWNVSINQLIKMEGLTQRLDKATKEY